MAKKYVMNAYPDLNYDGEINMNTLICHDREPVEGRFDGKVIIVTGGSSGIGLSIVEELLKEGACVVFTGRNMETAKKACAELDHKGLMNYMFSMKDMSEENAAKDTAEEAYYRFGRIDGLVNNAFFFKSTNRNLDNELWYTSFKSGPLNYARMMQAVYPYMIKAGGGSIVNVSSISGHIAQGGNWTYNTMKGVVGMLSKSAAMDFARDNIRVNMISPAHIWTRQTTGSFTNDDGWRSDPESRRNYARYTAKGYMLDRAGEPVECAAAALFLLSDDASYITGDEFMVDGGFITLGSQGAIDKGRRDEREYGLEPIYSIGPGHGGTVFTKPQRDYPELFREYIKEPHFEP